MRNAVSQTFKPKTITSEAKMRVPNRVCVSLLCNSHWIFHIPLSISYIPLNLRETSFLHHSKFTYSASAIIHLSISEIPNEKSSIPRYLPTVISELPSQLRVTKLTHLNTPSQKSNSLGECWLNSAILNSIYNEGVGTSRAENPTLF